ncbi:MAG: hypothetical protein IPK19_16055 [Chloroflexi bacterium]|nr:hypothetical protein [Chloroflexota bacterium]
MTTLILIFSAIASFAGLAVAGLYDGNSASLIPALQGQDLVTLLSLPVLGYSMFAARHGSPRALIVWAGMLGYLLYTYTGASMAYDYNVFYLMYVALFALNLFALVAVVGRIASSTIARAFDQRTPRRAVAAFLALMAFMLGMGELDQNLPYLTEGILPQPLQQAGGGTYFVYTLDLGLIVPLSILAAVWLLRRQPWGYVLAGCMLIKAAIMGLALLSMNGFGALRGLPLDSMLGLWVMIAVGGLVLSVWFLRHCRNERDSYRGYDRL